MHITTIQIDGVLGVSRVDVKTDAAIQLFAGSNHSGKSSIRDAVALAIAQETARGVTLKKDYAALVSDGAKMGGAQVVMSNDADQTFAFSMPTGKFSGPEISESMRVSLNGQRFAGMTADERRTFLFELTKCKPKTEAVRARMLELKCDPVKVEAVLPLLRTGFPSVCDHAKENATKAKGAWRGITGETWGAVKAPEWKAAVPPAAEGDVDQLKASLADIESNIATMNEALGKIKATQKTAVDNALKRATLDGTAKKVPDLTEQLTLANAELAKFEPTVIAMRERAGGTARIGLVHDMAEFVNDLKVADSATAVRQSILLAKYSKEYGQIGAKSDPEAQASLPKHEKGLLVMQNRVKNLQRDLDSAKAAKAQYDALEPAADVTDASAEIDEVTALIVKSTGDKNQLQNHIVAIEAVERNRAAAEKKTADALAHHNDVMAWGVVADALAPDGIPAEILAQALHPVNSTLEQAALGTDWAKVVIGADMAITAGGRPYNLLSESEQWRTDAMIAQTVSEISGLKIVMLDRVDVLDLKGRAQLLDWLDVLAMNDLLDTALLFATLKAPPQGLADTVQVHWVENGVIAGADQLAAA